MGDPAGNIKQLTLQGNLQVTKIAKITKFTKTAKFTVFRKSNDKIYECYSKGCKEGPSKVTKIAKFTIIRLSINEMHEIFTVRVTWKSPTKITKFLKTEWKEINLK